MRNGFHTPRKARNSRLLSEDVAAGRSVFRGLPEVVSLHTTERCNLRCVMCPRHDRVGRVALPRDALARVCDALFPTARKAIVTGNQGEPMASDLDVVIDAALAHGVGLDVVTNGTLLTGARYRGMVPALNHINVSIDSHRPDVYERIRLGASWARLHDNLRQVQAARREDPDPPLWTLSAVVMRSNIDHLAELVAFAAELGVDAVILQPLRQYAHRNAAEDVLRHGAADYHSGRGAVCSDPFRGDLAAREWLDRTLDPAREAARKGGINLYCADFQLPAVEVRALRHRAPYLADNTGACWYLVRNLSVFETGAVYPCCHPTDYQLGNVFRDDIAALWNGPRMQALRRAHFDRTGTLFCSGCLHAPYLPSPRPSRLRNGWKLGRLALGHARNAAGRARLQP